MMDFNIKMKFNLNEVNYNNRLYNKNEFQKAIEEFLSHKQIHLGELFDNEYTFRDFDVVDLVNSSHKINDVVINDDNSVNVIGETLPTREGNYLKSLIKQNKVFIIPRGIGEIELNENKQEIVKNYKLLTFDFVTENVFNKNDEEVKFDETPLNALDKIITNDFNELLNNENVSDKQTTNT